MSAAASPQGAVAADELPTTTSVWDADVHHGWGGRPDLFPYLPDVHRERFSMYGLGAGLQPGTDRGSRGHREDSLVDGKIPDGSAVVTASPELTRTQLLDGCGVDWALLTGGQFVPATTHADREYASVLMRAFNDYSVEHWLGADDRFRLALAITPRDPAAAAAEIVRLGDHPGVVAVILPSGATMPYGQRFYQPIHEACAERDLVLCLHSGAEGLGVNPAPTPAGYPSYYAETVLARLPPLQVHIASFVFEGVFTSFPGLKVAVLEGGVTWVAPYLWFMDQSWEALRHQTPWVERHPSEYVLEHFRFTTRPTEVSVPEAAAADLLRWMKAEETMMFSSDYPRWDWDDPARISAAFPDKLRERVLSGNASEFFRR